jgi:hypothetical protein
LHPTLPSSAPAATANAKLVPNHRDIGFLMINIL